MLEHLKPYQRKFYDMVNQNKNSKVVLVWPHRLGYRRYLKAVCELQERVGQTPPRK